MDIKLSMKRTPAVLAATAALLAAGLVQEPLKAQAGWATFQDPRGVRLQVPAGWNASVDGSSTRITVRGGGASLVIQTALFGQPLNGQSAGFLLTNVAKTIDGGIAWGKPEAAGANAVRMVGGDGAQAAICLMRWNNVPAGAAAYFAVSKAPRANYRSLTDAFNRILGSLQLTGAGENAKAPAPAMRYTAWTDPNERAFSVEVPADWKVSGGLLRRSSTDVTTVFVVQSPDGAVRVNAGDANIPAFAMPNQMLAMAGLGEGSWYNVGYGNRLFISRYMPGVVFAKDYATRGNCPGFQLGSEKDRTTEFNPVNAQYAQFASMGIQARVTAGEVRFRCTGTAGYIFAATLMAQQAQGPGTWVVERLFGYQARNGSEPLAQQVLQHVFETLRVSPQWAAMQDGLTQRTSQIVARTMQEISNISK